MAWTEQMVEDLKKMWHEGLTTGEIGKRLGVSKNSIVGKVHRLQLSGRPSPIKKKDEISEEKAAPAKPAKEEKAAPVKAKEEKRPEPAKEEKFEPVAKIPTWTTIPAVGPSATPKTKTSISAAKKSKSARPTAKSMPTSPTSKPERNNY